MKLVYIAGPYRAKNGWELELNIRAAEEYIEPLAKIGVVPVCVHSMYRYLDRTMTDKYWIDATLEIMAVCDAVFLVPHPWGTSEGTVGEFIEAKKIGLPVFRTMEELKALLDV